jgi:hypothetical protein
MSSDLDLFGHPPVPLPGPEISSMNRGMTGENEPLPAPSDPIVKSGPGLAPPVALPHRGSVATTTSTFDNGGSDPTEAGKLKTALVETRDALATWAGIVAGYDKTLDSYWPKKDSLFDQIVNTHGKSVAYAARLIYNAFGKEERAKLFEASDALAVEYGPVLTKRRDAAKEVKLLTQEIEHINKRLDQLAKRKKK